MLKNNSVQSRQGGKIMILSQEAEKDRALFSFAKNPDGKAASLVVFKGGQSFVFLPFFWIFFFFRFLAVGRENISAIIAGGKNEKLALALPAAILKIKYVWLEDGEKNFLEIRGLPFLLYRLLARRALIAVSANRLKETMIARKIRKENVFLLPPRAEISDALKQENIFSRIADQGDNSFKKKFFSIGAIIPKKTEENKAIEALIMAAKNCHKIISGVKIVIVSSGEEAKKFSWLVKKLGVENAVLLISGQEQAEKWLADWNAVLLPLKNGERASLNFALGAMRQGKIVIAPEGKGFEDIITDAEDGLLARVDEAENLTEKIISLAQNQEWQKKISQRAVETSSAFSEEKQKKILKEIIYEN